MRAETKVRISFLTAFYTSPYRKDQIFKSLKTGGFLKPEYASEHETLEAAGRGGAKGHENSCLNTTQCTNEAQSYI